jgi:hypothetical protein
MATRQPVAMLIADRPPEAETGEGGYSPVTRLGAAQVMSSPPTPSEELLPSGGLSPQEVGAWNDRDDALAREVAIVRAHLAPLASRTALAGSYGREAFHRARPATHGELDQRADHLRVTATRIAYAIRWLELGDGIERPRWPSLLDPAA